jgi:hypothetical protein
MPSAMSGNAPIQKTKQNKKTSPQITRPLEADHIVKPQPANMAAALTQKHSTSIPREGTVGRLKVTSKTLLGSKTISTTRVDYQTSALGRSRLVCKGWKADVSSRS